MMRGFSLKLTRRWWWSSYCGNLMRGGGDMWETAAHRSNSTVDALNAEVGKTHRQWGITFLAIFGDSLTPFAESLSFAQLHAGRRRRMRSWSTMSYVREVLCSESLRVTWLVINKQALLELRILVSVSMQPSLWCAASCFSDCFIFRCGKLLIRLQIHSTDSSSSSFSSSDFFFFFVVSLFWQ